jgi:hypothetical protein
MICWILFSWLGLELHLASMVLLDVISIVLLLLWKNSDVLCVAWCCVQEQWCSCVCPVLVE